MEVKAREKIGMGKDVIPPIPPLAFSLLDSTLHSHCSSCFSLIISSPHFTPAFPTDSHHILTTTTTTPPAAVRYCSLNCSSADSNVHFSSAEHYLPSPSSDLRLALRLLHHFHTAGLIPPHSADVPARIGGLLSNREKLINSEEGNNDDVRERIRVGAKAMAAARRLRDGLDLSFDQNCLVEEAVLCVVMTNAVEVQIGSGSGAVGVAVYDATFSWINHSCSPNACYRFLLPEMGLCAGDESNLLISSAAVDDGAGLQGYGPRVIVRSIRAIEKGEEICIAYTDLLQPKDIRQSELWSKYRFVCHCRRCSSCLPNYVDHVLQEIFAVNRRNQSSSDYNHRKDEVTNNLADYVDDAVSEYLSFSNPETCCEKLEKLLVHGLLVEQVRPKGGKSQQVFKLHPVHSLSLNAYTTLASAYRSRSSDILVIDPESSKHQLETFNLGRTSTAYSLLLAGATHSLFLYETSLIASVENFWTSAGESLLSLARNSIWNLSVNSGLELPVSEVPPFQYKCSRCALFDRSTNNYISSQDKSLEFEEKSKQFLDCIACITPNIWSFLNSESLYLEQVKNPVDFSWLDSIKNLEMCTNEESFASRSEAGYANRKGTYLFQLAAHCITYGEFLSSICYG